MAEEHWAIVDLKGKAGRTRTIPRPNWVKVLVDDWLQAANLTTGKLFRRVNKNGKAWGEGLTEKAIWRVVREYARKAGIEKLAPHDIRRYAESRTCRIKTRPSWLRACEMVSDIGSANDAA